jgi:hypothetical protein
MWLLLAVPQVAEQHSIAFNTIYAKDVGFLRKLFRVDVSPSERTGAVIAHGLRDVLS